MRTHWYVADVIARSVARWKSRCDAGGAAVSADYADEIATLRSP